jgi:hypothetical protein
MPRFDPWNNKRFGFPRKDAPAFQREWVPMSSSGVTIDNAATATEQVIIKPTSSVGVSGTIYLWGLSYVVPTAAPHAGTIIDDNGKEILTVVATENGPFFLQLSTPIQITANSGLKFKTILTSAASYCTPLYVNTRLNYES